MHLWCNRQGEASYSTLMFGKGNTPDRTLIYIYDLDGDASELVLWEDEKYNRPAYPMLLRGQLKGIFTGKNVPSKVDKTYGSSVNQIVLVDTDYSLIHFKSLK